METIKEEEEKIEQESSGLKEWTEEDNDEMGNICNPYYELWKFLGWGILKEGWCYDTAKKWLSYYLFSFSFSFLFN